MREGDNLEQLRAELRLARVLLQEVKALSKQTFARPFTEVLHREKQRAQRYNHYFSIIVLTPDNVDAQEVLRRSMGLVRGSDVLGIVDPKGSYHQVRWRGEDRESVPVLADAEGTQMVAVILPETDRKGAETAANRLASVLVDDDKVKIGMAVYPDDGGDVKELIAVAAV